MTKLFCPRKALLMNCLRLLIFTALIGLVLLSGMGVANAQLVGVSPQTLSFAYQVGGSNPASQVLYLSGSSPTQFTVTISGAPWLTVSPTTGITPSTLVASIAVTRPSPRGRMMARSSSGQWRQPGRRKRL